MQQLVKKFTGEVKNGKVCLYDTDKWNMLVWRHEGKRVVLSLSPFKKPRSNEENRYMWGVVCEILADYLGEEPEWVHENIIIGMFGRQVYHKEISGKVVEFEVFVRTSGLSTVEFEDRMTRIRQWASKELGIYIPLPNEVELEKINY